MKPPATLAAPVATTALLGQMSEIRAQQERLSQMEKDLITARNQKMGTIHTELGFANPEEFLKTYRTVITSGNAKPARSGARKNRTEISPEVREAIKQELRNGKTALEVAAKFKISTGTVQNIKKEAGLVHARS